MKKIYSILAIAGLISLCGCDNRAEIDTPFEGVRMSLRIEGSEIVTKATEGGEDTFNENTIKTIHYYFFDQTAGTLVYGNTQTINKTGEADIALAGINSTIFNNIFSGRTALDVLVVVNATTPDGTVSTTTKDDILATTVALSGFGKQENLVMTGEGTLTKAGASTASVEVSLSRVASKITLHLIVPDSYIDGASKTWNPQLGSIKVDFKGLGKNTLVSGEAAADTLLGNAHLKATSTSNDFTLEDAYDTATPPVKIGKEVSLKVPVYSYPRKWNNGDETTPYIYITLPWKMEGETTTADTYYKILLPGTSLDQNTWYDITGKLGGLGSLVKEGTTTIEDLTINVSKDWKDAIGEGHNNTDADMAMPRILAVEKNTYVIYNQNSIEIPFVSSHNCTVGTITVDQDSHPSSMGTLVTPTAVVDNAGRTITFTHTLDNDQSSKPYDYLTFKAHFTLQHTDDANYKEVVYIEQRPALCVEQFNNENGFRNVFVNGTQEVATGTTYNPHRWSILRGNSSGGSGSYNPNVLQITASVLPTTGSMADYMIGDPRIKTNNLTSAPFTTVPGTTFNSGGTNYTQPSFATDSNGEPLEYYYSAGPETADIVAPSFRISSSYGGTGGEDFGANSYNYLQLRCAAYQEAGYPAGRWRLPTVAELTYCLQLQADACLGNGIFKTDVYYMSASGVGVGIYSGVVKTNTSATNIRCVYDAWYWDNTDFPRLPDNQYLYSECGTTNSNYKFVWGDAPISW